jgi:hypothetical protein
MADAALTEFQNLFNSVSQINGDVAEILGPLQDFVSELGDAPHAITFGVNFLNELSGVIGDVADAESCITAIEDSNGDPGVIAAQVYGFFLDACWQVISDATPEGLVASLGVSIAEGLFDKYVKVPAMQEVQYLVDKALSYNPAQTTLQLSDNVSLLSLPAGATSATSPARSDSAFIAVTSGSETLSGSVVNISVLEALSGGTLSLNGATTNRGLVEALSGGLVVLEGAANNNTDGTIKAASGGAIEIDGTVSGGTILMDTSGALQLGNGSTLRGVTLGGDGTGSFTGYGVNELQNVTLLEGETFTIYPSYVTGLKGTITNAGLLFAPTESDGEGGEYVGIFVADGPVTLTGGGKLQINGGFEPASLYANDDFFSASGPDQLTNVNNTITGAGTIGVDVINQADGVIDGDGLALNAGLTNRGLVEALSGGLVVLDGATTNAKSGVIKADKGTINVGGSLVSLGIVEALAGGDLKFAGGLTSYGSLTIDSASKERGSAISVAGVLANRGTATIGNAASRSVTSLTADGMDNGGTLAIRGSASDVTQVTISGAANNYGNLTIGSHSLVQVSERFAQFAGSTTVAGSLEASQVVDAGGLIDFESAQSSPAALTVVITKAATAEFQQGVASGDRISFKTTTGDLQLRDVSAFSGTISGFTGDDEIDLLDTVATSASFSKGVLTLYDGTTAVGELTLTGSYKTSNFQLKSDTHGGTEILDPAVVSSAPHTALLVQAMASFNVAPAASLVLAVFARDSDTFPDLLAGSQLGTSRHLMG